jgi:hypothetical protein
MLLGTIERDGAIRSGIDLKIVVGRWRDRHITLTGRFCRSRHYCCFLKRISPSNADL